MFGVNRTITVISGLPAEFLCSNILTETETTVDWDKSLILHSLAHEIQGHQLGIRTWELGKLEEISNSHNLYFPILDFMDFGPGFYIDLGLMTLGLSIPRHHKVAEKC